MVIQKISACLAVYPARGGFGATFRTLRVARPRCVVSRQAIAAALARSDLAGGERLVAFSLASFAGRDDRAWPGAPAAAVRAGLSRSRYLYVRDRLVERGLVVVESEASGRGRASVLALPFVSAGPWWEGEINAELFEAVLSRTRRRGPARLLMAAMAALADADAIVRGLSSEELCVTAGMADRTYRRARQELLESGELELLSGAGGRGNANVWQVRASAETPAGGAAGLAHRRVIPPAGRRPLLATVASPTGENCLALTGVPAGKGGQDRTVSEQNCPVSFGVSDGKGGRDRTLFDLLPIETPAEDVLAGRAGAEDAIVTGVHGVDVIASGRDLAGIELALVGELGRERFLRDALEPVLAEYDHVVIDTPPNLGLLTVNALVLAEVVIAPVSAKDEESLHSIRELQRTVRRLADRLDRPALEIIAILTRWQPLRISSRIIEHGLVCEGLTPAVRIPARSALLARAAADRVPLAVSASDSSPAIAYHHLAEQLAAVSAR